MIHFFRALAVGLVVMGIGSACSGKCAYLEPVDINRPIAYAVHTSEAVINNGKLDESAWQRAPRYRLTRPLKWEGYYASLTAEEKAKYGDDVLENAYLQMLYDEENLYLGFTLEDFDIKASGVRDQEMHFILGDLIEVFIKPDFADYYWELYSTPKAHKTALEFFARRSGIEGNENIQLDFTVSSSLNGTLNDSADADKGWSTLVTIPFKSLAKHGDAFCGNGTWTLLIGRYNYLADGEYAKEELSAFPQITEVDFHSLDEYAAIVFVPAK